MGSHSVTTDRDSSLSSATATDWAVLGFLAERPRHGFEIARELSPASSVGRVWTVSRPLVYRALDRLRRRDWIRRRGHEQGHKGPEREVLEITSQGEEVFRSWLNQPVHHLRDVRSLLLLKLYFLERRGESTATLRHEQRRILQPMAESLARQASGTQGFDRRLYAWRLHFTAAVDGFLQEGD